MTRHFTLKNVATAREGVHIWLGEGIPFNVGLISQLLAWVKANGHVMTYLLEPMERVIASST